MQQLLHNKLTLHSPSLQKAICKLAKDQRVSPSNQIRQKGKKNLILILSMQYIYICLYKVFRIFVNYIDLLV